MLNKNKYWKSLLGTQAEVLVGKQTAYTDSESYADFVDEAAEGEIGIFKSDGTAYDGTTAAENTDRLFAALKRDGLIEKTNEFSLGAFEVSRAAYAAAVKQKTTIALAGAAVSGKYYELKVIETTPGYDQFPTWLYGYTAKSTDTSGTVAGAIADMVNDANSVINRDRDQVAKATALQGVASVAVTAGGSGYTSAPTVAFANAPAGGTKATGYATISDGAVTSVVITNPGSGYTSAPAITFSGGAGTGAAATATLGPNGTIVLEALEAGPTFQVALSADTLEDLAPVVTRTANASWGSGTYDQIKELEFEGDVLKGVTTQYPQDGTRPEDFGEPSVFASPAAQYSVYIISGAAKEWSPTPVEQHVQPRLILLAVPSNGTNPDTEVKKVLGV